MSSRWRIDPDGHLDCDELTSRLEVIAALETWLDHSSAPTIGDTTSYGGRPLVRFLLADRRAHVNADTRRSAVEAAVAAHRRHQNQAWRVVPNRNGIINKILPWPHDGKLTGWFAYLAEPLDREGTL